MNLHYETLSDHLTDILQWWKPAVDHENGGISYIFHGDGAPTFEAGGSKDLVMHVRQLYNYSAGAHFGVAGAEGPAHHLYTTLDSLFGSANGLYPSRSVPPLEAGGRNRDEKFVALDGHDHYYSYAQYYAVIGLARYARALKDRNALERAWSLMRDTRKIFCKDPFRDNGSWSWYMPDRDECHGLSGDTHLHYLEALVNLQKAELEIYSEADPALMSATLADMFSEAYDFFETHILDKETFTTREVLGASGAKRHWQKAPYDAMAHSLEWLGFWYEAGTLLEKEFRVVTEHADQIADTALQRCLANNGCFKNRFYLAEQKSDVVSDFWGQVEAVLGFLWAARICDNPSFAAAACRAAEFYFDHFCDSKYGGVFSEVTEEGIVINRWKGTSIKCDHHSLRMCEMIIENELLPVRD